MKKICLIPNIWNDFNIKIKALKPENIPEPPIPLILAGWNYSSDYEKELRWAETVDWCKKYGFESELELLKDEYFYCVE